MVKIVSLPGKFTVINSCGKEENSLEWIGREEWQSGCHMNLRVVQEVKRTGLKGKEVDWHWISLWHSKDLEILFRTVLQDIGRSEGLVLRQSTWVKTISTTRCAQEQLHGTNRLRYLLVRSYDFISDLKIYGTGLEKLRWQLISVTGTRIIQKTMHIRHYQKVTTPCLIATMARPTRLLTSSLMNNWSRSVSTVRGFRPNFCAISL